MTYGLFRRQPVEQQFSQRLQTKTFPAPTRGLIMNENESYMLPGGALVQDNWMPTLRGVKLRGGFERHCDLHALDAIVPPVPDSSRKPVISAFEYVSGDTQRIFAAQATKLFEVTDDTPVLIKSGQSSGNYSASQFSNAAGTWLIALNDAGDLPLRYNGSTWITVDPTGGPPSDGASAIAGPPSSPVSLQDGLGLTFVWKYRNRLFFIQGGTMDAWCLPIDAVGGTLIPIPLGGSATKGGSLLFGANWSIDAGDGVDDKCVFVTDLGEVLVFTGSNPADVNNWSQEGRYNVSPPLGMNAFVALGGDLLLLTVDGIVPLSQAINKDAGQLELALLTRTIDDLWHADSTTRRQFPWTAKRWDEYSALFVTTPGGVYGDRRCLVTNNVTGAWCRFTPDYDATCFIRMHSDLYFGTQDGIIMQAEVGGMDDGRPYVATLVGGWEMFGAPSNQFVWHQARASFRANASESFQPQLTSTVNYIINIPPPPTVGVELVEPDVWDQGKWGPVGATIPPTIPDLDAYAQWDQPAIDIVPVRDTLWQSIGMTGFAHAPIVQVTIGQTKKPSIELISVAATYEPAGVNV